jgi:hypothetical protein
MFVNIPECLICFQIGSGTLVSEAYVSVVVLRPRADREGGERGRGREEEGKNVSGEKGRKRKRKGDLPARDILSQSLIVFAPSKENDEMQPAMVPLLLEPFVVLV